MKRNTLSARIEQDRSRSDPLRQSLAANPYIHVLFTEFEKLQDPKDIDDNITSLETEEYKTNYAHLDVETLLMRVETLLKSDSYEDEILYILYLAIQKGSIEAAFSLGKLYSMSLSNKISGAHWIRDAAERGDKGAKSCIQEMLIQIKECYEIRPGLPSSPEMLCYGAALGYPPAQLDLAKMYLLGMGPNKDEQKALKLMRKAARQNYAEAQVYLGTILRDGFDTISVNLDEAMDWLKKGQKQGHPLAGQELAKMRKLCGARLSLREMLNPDEQKRAGLDRMSKQQRKRMLRRLAENTKGSEYEAAEKKKSKIKPEESEEDIARRNAKNLAFKQALADIHTQEIKKADERKVAIALLDKEAQAKKAEIKSILSLKMLNTALQKIQKTRNNFEARAQQREQWKGEMVKSIQCSTGKLEKYKEKRFTYVLPRILDSTDQLNNLHKDIITSEDEMLKKIFDFCELCQGLQGQGSEGALTKEEEIRLGFRFENFSEVRMYLGKEIDDANIMLLKKACFDLKKEWSSILDDDAKFKELINKYKALHKEISERETLVNSFKESQRKAKGIDESNIINLTKEINDKLLQLQGKVMLPVQNAAPTVVEASQPVNASVIEQPLVITEATPSVISVPIDDVQETQDRPLNEELKQISEDSLRDRGLPVDREERRKEMWRRKRVLRTLANGMREKFEIMLHTRRTMEEQLEREAQGIKREIKVIKESPKQSEHSTELRLQLEQLKIIVTQLKTARTNGELSIFKNFYALFGSLAQTNEIVSLDKSKDSTVCEVARRVRNAIYKQYAEIQEAAGTSSSLLSIIEAWCKVIDNREIGLIKDEEAVVNRIHSNLFAEMYNLGKKLDGYEKNRDGYWRKKKKPNILQCVESIEKMKMYWGMRRQEGKEIAEEGMINTAADDFCWGIIGSAVSNLQKAVNDRISGAKEAFEYALGLLAPYCSSDYIDINILVRALIDKGILARHKWKILKNTINVPFILMDFSMSAPVREPVREVVELDLGVQVFPSGEKRDVNDCKQTKSTPRLRPEPLRESTLNASVVAYLASLEKETLANKQKVQCELDVNDCKQTKSAPRLRPEPLRESTLNASVVAYLASLEKETLANKQKVQCELTARSAVPVMIKVHDLQPKAVANMRNNNCKPTQGFSIPKGNHTMISFSYKPNPNPVVFIPGGEKNLPTPTVAFNRPENPFIKKKLSK